MRIRIRMVPASQNAYCRTMTCHVESARLMPLREGRGRICCLRFGWGYRDNERLSRDGNFPACVLFNRRSAIPHRDRWESHAAHSRFDPSVHFGRRLSGSASAPATGIGCGRAAVSQPGVSYANDPPIQCKRRSCMQEILEQTSAGISVLDRVNEVVRNVQYKDWMFNVIASHDGAILLKITPSADVYALSPDVEPFT